MKNYIFVSMAVNNEYVTYLSVVISSLEKTNSFYHIIILYSDLSQQNIRRLKEWADDKRNISISFENVSKVLANTELFVGNKDGGKYLSVETYYRLLLVDLFPNIDKIIYLDADVVVMSDLAEVFNISLDGYMVAAVPDVVDNWKTLYDKKKQEYMATELGITEWNDYFNAGVLVLNLREIRKKYTSKQLLNIAQSKKWLKHDQDVLNFICGGSFYNLGYKWNCISVIDKKFEKKCPYLEIEKYNEANQNPAIVHYAAKKPWKNIDVEHEELFWDNAISSAFFREIVKEYFKEKRIIDQTANKMIANGKLGIRFIFKCIVSFLNIGVRNDNNMR